MQNIMYLNHYNFHRIDLQDLQALKLLVTAITVHHRSHRFAQKCILYRSFYQPKMAQFYSIQSDTDLCAAHILQAVISQLSLYCWCFKSLTLPVFFLCLGSKMFQQAFTLKCNKFHVALLCFQPMLATFNDHSTAVPSSVAQV